MIAIGILVLLLSQEAADSTVIAAVRAAVMRAPVGAFRADSAGARIRDISLLDIDGDGAPEAFVAIAPSYRQTPTVLVYKYSPNSGARPLLEALAPGRLGRATGDLLDLHASGSAMDLTLGDGRKAVDTMKFVTTAARQGMSVVRYQSFFHTDMRQGSVAYVDLADRKLPGSATTTCARLDFGAVEALASGRLAGDTTYRYLVALTAKDVTVYRFDGVSPQQMLLKRTWVRDRPGRVTGITTRGRDEVMFTLRDGTTHPISAP